MENNENKRSAMLNRLAKWLRAASAVAGDTLNVRLSPDLGNPQHMRYAAQWIAAAQASTLDGGVSLAYSLKNGWRPSYPETTGYIIPTLFNYSHLTGDDAWWDRAVSMADWLLTVQLSDGAFGHPSDLSRPIVFDTGQIVFGFLAAFRETNGEQYRDAAAKAACWLAAVQDPSGCWQKHTYGGTGRVYHARVAWALAEASKVLQDDDLLGAACQNLDWTVAQQRPNGWFENNTFPDETYPTLHTIAYATRALLEAGLLLHKSEYLEAAALAAKALLLTQRTNGALPGAFNHEWQSMARWSCLSGNAQTAIIWFKEYKRTGNPTFLEAGKRATTFLKATQVIHTRLAGTLGGIKGSHPIQSQYMPFSYPNWAAKFFLDALMWEEAAMRGSEDGGHWPVLPG